MPSRRMEIEDLAPCIGDVVVLPSGRRVMLTTAPYRGFPWIATKVRCHWEVLRPGLSAPEPVSFAIGKSPAPGLDEADACALAVLLNAVRPAPREAAGIAARKSRAG